MKCLILASGFGTRLYPLTRDKAKGLIEYEGKPLLTHIVERIPRNIDIFVATNRKFEMDFRRWRKAIDRRIEISVEADSAFSRQPELDRPHQGAFVVS